MWFGIVSLCISYVAVASFIFFATNTHFKWGISAAIFIDMIHRTNYFVAKSYVPPVRDWMRQAYIRSTISGPILVMPLVYVCIHGDSIVARALLALSIVTSLANGMCVKSDVGDGASDDAPLDGFGRVEDHGSGHL